MVVDIHWLGIAGDLYGIIIYTTISILTASRQPDVLHYAYLIVVKTFTKSTLN